MYAPSSRPGTLSDLSRITEDSVEGSRLFIWEDMKEKDEIKEEEED
jgi:hypothetical protein